MAGREDPIFHAHFQCPREEWLKYRWLFIAQMSVGQYGKCCWKTSASTDLDMSKHEEKQPHTAFMLVIKLPVLS